MDPADREDARRVDGTEGAERCDFCRSRIPVQPWTMEYDGTVYTFCTEACREAMRERDRVFTTYRGDRWIRPGVTALSAKLPQGIPRNSAVLLSGQPGARESELQAEIVWRTLQRGEPAVLVTFKEPPISLVELFLSLDWNVLPYLEAGQLHVLDCFTYRVADRDRLYERMSDWNSHLLRIAQPAVTSVQDPTNIGQLENRLDDCLTGKSMVDRGVVMIDSLTEVGALLQPVRAYNYVKDVRASVAKARFVPVFAGASYLGESGQFPHDLQYLFDGIIDLELNHQLVEDTLIKRIRVRKMSGALNYPEWTAYEFTSGDGLVMFDPREEIEKGRAADDGGDGGGTRPPGG